MGIAPPLYFELPHPCTWKCTCNPHASHPHTSQPPTPLTPHTCHPRIIYIGTAAYQHNWLHEHGPTQLLHSLAYTCRNRHDFVVSNLTSGNVEARAEEADGHKPRTSYAMKPHVCSSYSSPHPTPHLTPRHSPLTPRHSPRAVGTLSGGYPETIAPSTVVAHRVATCGQRRRAWALATHWTNVLKERGVREGGEGGGSCFVRGRGRLLSYRTLLGT